jgi:uncharacterized membrane protein YfhO
MAVSADYQVKFPESGDLYSILAAEGIEFLLSHSGEVLLLLSRYYIALYFGIIVWSFILCKLTSIRCRWNIFMVRRFVSSSLQSGAGPARTSLQS